MAGESHATTDHNEIQKWVEERQGKPATVKSTTGKEDAGLLRIDFPGYSGSSSLEEISWDEFFNKFDEKNLAFLYQVKTSGGEVSRFCKFISRDSEEYTKHKSSSHSSGHSEYSGHASHASTHKTEDKAHMTEYKSGHKTDSKAHNTTHKLASKSKDKVAPLSAEQAHKIVEKLDAEADKAEQKAGHTTSKAADKTHKAEHKIHK